MQFWDPIMASVHRRGLKERTVTSANTERCPMLEILTGGMLLPDTNVKRLMVIRRKKLEYYPMVFLDTIMNLKCVLLAKIIMCLLHKERSMSLRRHCRSIWLKFMIKLVILDWDRDYFTTDSMTIKMTMKIDDADDSKTKSCAGSVSEPSSGIESRSLNQG